MFRETIYERPLTSEPFIENQSEHISKLSLHQSLVKRKFITKRYSLFSCDVIIFQN